MIGGYGGYGGYGGHVMGWFGGIFMIVFWGLVLVAIVLLIRWLAVAPRNRETGGGAESPLEILKKRYARGEINKEEFEEKKKDLL
jgi:putative membrane protein